MSAQSPPRLVIERLPDFEAARGDWTRLAQAGGNVFSTYEWADAWQRHLGAGLEVVVATCRHPGGDVVAILPLVFARKAPLRIVRFVGSGPSDQIGPVCARVDLPDVVAALKHLVDAELDGGGIFLAERLWGDDGLTPMLEGTVVRRAASPVIEVGGRGFDDLLASRSRNFREQVRRRERKLAREHRLAYRLSDDPERLAEDMSTLISLHAARWRDGSSRAFGGPLEAFHRDFAASALERGWLRLWIMELDGRPAAAWYGLRYGGIESYYQAGRDPQFDHYSAGFVLLCHSIRSAFEDGVREYRFGLGDEPYKERFAERDPGLDTVALPAGRRGRLALAGIRAALRMPASVRSRLSLLGGLRPRAGRASPAADRIERPSHP